MNRTRAIRLSSEDAEKIEKFLALNPFFDFSSLARTAILSFIESPTVEIRPLVQKKDKFKIHKESRNNLGKSDGL